jgi:hypothetical protein
VGVRSHLSWFERATRLGETGALARTIDWSATSLGPPESWPASLRIAVETCMTTRFPMLVVWGPDLVKIYNDGYRDMLGTEKHPRAMGSPASEVWPEIWDTIHPLFDQVLGTGEPILQIDQLLVMNRNGFPEETFFTYSYSPLRDDEGIVCGVLDTAMETTEQVVSRRRLRCLSRLTALLQAAAGDVVDVCNVAVEVLADAESDIVAADVHVRAGDDLVPLASTRGSASVSAVDVEVLRRCVDDFVEVIDEHGLVAPLIGQGERIAAGVIVLEPNPLRPLDDGYQTFLRLVASAVGTAVTGALRRGREIDDLRRISESLQRSMLPTIAPDPAVAVRYLTATGGLTVGGDWYDVVDLGSARTAISVGDCVGNGLEAAAAMGQLRSASRALLLEDRGPAATVAALDLFAHSIEGAQTTTVVCGIVDEATRLVTYASAGHLPALLVRQDGSHTWLDDAQHVPLDTFDVGPRGESTASLGPGDMLILYTDGLVERRGESLDAGFARLAAAATACRDQSVEEVADALLGALLPDGPQDDVALLVHRLIPGTG